MPNVLGFGAVESIRNLRLRDWSQRRIANELGINRETVSRYCRLAESERKPANPTSSTTSTNEGPAMITDAQVRKLRQLLSEGKPLSRAALKVGTDAKSARKYRHADRQPSKSENPRTWRTRQDPFHDVWPQLRDLLKQSPGLDAKSLFCDLQRHFPDRFPDVQLRTLQRKIRAWRATESPAHETILGQFRRPQQLDALCSEDHRWMLRILQGKEPINPLEIAPPESESFHKIVSKLRRGTLKDRNKSLTVVAKLYGISIRSISRFLHIDRKTALGYWNTYERFGCERLFKGIRLRIAMSQDEALIDIVFAILHTPPSAFDINRTTWKMSDLRLVLGENGHKVSIQAIRNIIKNAGYRWRVARKVLTSNDPKYREKLAKIQSILSTLGLNERFFSIDEYGPFAVKVQGGRSLMPPGEIRAVPQRQKSKGRLILTAALELSTNQVTHFYSEKKNTAEMIKLLDLLLVQYAECDKIYFSWDAASWHASKALNKRVDEVNAPAYKARHRCPIVELVPLPCCAQFLNVIESVFSGMAKAIIHNSDYESLIACQAAIDRYFRERNEFFQTNPKRAGKKIWRKESTPSEFSPSNNCKDPKYHYLGI
jgi:predicted transcriptional regulator/transposase